MESGRVRAHVFVSGRVQGVFFRQETYRRATRGAGPGIEGWVRNLPNGQVEAIFEGPRFAVEALVAWVREGPRAAVVDNVDVHWEKPVGEGAFRIR